MREGASSIYVLILLNYTSQKHPAELCTFTYRVLHCRVMYFVLQSDAIQSAVLPSTALHCNTLCCNTFSTICSRTVKCDNVMKAGFPTRQYALTLPASNSGFKLRDEIYEMLFKFTKWMYVSWSTFGSLVFQCTTHLTLHSFSLKLCSATIDLKT